MKFTPESRTAFSNVSTCGSVTGRPPQTRGPRNSMAPKPSRVTFSPVRPSVAVGNLIISSPLVKSRLSTADRCRRNRPPSHGRLGGRWDATEQCALLQLAERFLDLGKVRQLFRVVARLDVADDAVFVHDNGRTFRHTAHAEIELRQ